VPSYREMENLNSVLILLSIEACQGMLKKPEK
jgi:hypothetical protein